MLTFFADHLLESLLVSRRPARVVVKQLGVKGVSLFGNVVAQLPLLDVGGDAKLGQGGVVLFNLFDTLFGLQSGRAAAVENLSACEHFSFRSDLGHNPVPDVHVAAKRGLQLAPLRAEVLVSFFHVVGAVLDLTGRGEIFNTIYNVMEVYMIALNLVFVD